jgi:hypothetical protein
MNGRGRPSRTAPTQAQTQPRTNRNPSDRVRRPYRGATARYVAGREDVLGGRVHIHDDPQRAARDLSERLGGPEATRAWLAAALAELDR